jgi:eukaryotic-like serine/threonine-protein kinase
MNTDPNPQPDPDPAAAEASAAQLHRFENAEFDPVEGELRVDGQPVALEPRPLRLLAELLRRVDSVVTKEELLNAVWDGRPTVEHVVANAVSKLRAALGPLAAARLQTLPRVGYRLVGPIQRMKLDVPDLVLEPGQAVPHREAYLLERPLGAGQLRDVWLARHAKLGQLRVFKFAVAGPRLTSLRREFTLYRVLQAALGARPDIAVVADSNFVAAPYFLECEYGGESLLDWVDRSPDWAAMPIEDRLALFIQVAQAVQAAHGAGVLHKDLKPANILLDSSLPAPQIRITDFGSGRLLDSGLIDRLQLTALGLSRTVEAASAQSGTYAYLAPEVLAGQPPSVQSDVYALGLILFQLVVGDFRRPMATGWQRDVGDELLRDDIAMATDGRLDVRLASAALLV